MGRARISDGGYRKTFLYELTEKEEILNSVYYKEMLLIIQLTLEKMPKRRRLIFELSRFRGLSHKEIADKLDVSIRTIEHQVYLALIELKKVLLFFYFFSLIFLSSMYVVVVFSV